MSIFSSQIYSFQQNHYQNNFMNVNMEEAEAKSGRFRFHTHNNILTKYGTHTNIKDKKRSSQDEHMQSISPWDADQFVSLKKKQQQNFKKWNEECIGDRKYCKTLRGNQQFSGKVYTEACQAQSIQKKKRTKTEVQKNESSSKVRLNTIEVSNQMNFSNQKYFSQEYPNRKMSMSKLREVLTETARGVSSNKFFVQTKADITKKIEQKMSGSKRTTQYSQNRNYGKKAIGKEVQNETPLMFFFEAKTSKNMMERQKNIMKIRNISKRSKKINTNAI